MKNYLSFLAIAALFAACQSNPNEELGVFFRAGQEVTLTANMPAGNNSAQQLSGKQRVSGKDSNPTDPTNGTINLTWDAGDVILVKVADKTAEFTLQDGAGTAQATFKGVMPADGTEYSVQYPVSEPNLTTQTYIQNGFGNGLMKMATETNGTIDGGFTLKAKNALLGLQLTGNQILSKIVITNLSDYKTYTLFCPNVTLSTTPTLFYIIIPAGLWANGFVVDVYVDDNIISSFSKIDNINFPTDIATIMPPKDISVSHSYVDLGLSVRWATCNVGAVEETDFGDYFAWGETQPKDQYTWTTYQYANDGTATTLQKYGVVGATGVVDNKYNLDPEDDAATVNWGNPWRMPTDDEISELINNCTWTRTSRNGIEGFSVKSKSNDNTIFLPAGGYRTSSSLQHENVMGNYYSSTLYMNGDHKSQMGCELNFNATSSFLAGIGRHVGCLVRPVYP